MPLISGYTGPTDVSTGDQNSNKYSFSRSRPSLTANSEVWVNPINDNPTRNKVSNTQSFKSLFNFTLSNNLNLCYFKQFQDILKT